MTYILEKRYELDDNNHLFEPQYYNAAIIRAFSLEYDEMRAFFMCRSNLNRLPFSVRVKVRCFNVNPRHKTIDEWLIWLSLNEGIVPDFEETHLVSWRVLYNGLMKITDLRTNDVLYDNAEAEIARLKSRLFGK